MSTSRQEKLQLALANARTVLGKGATGGRPALSKLNRLRGVESVSDTRDGNLISRTRVKTRPVFDMVADDILGETAPWSPSIDLEEGESSLAQIAAKRINEMREKQVTEEISDDLLGDSVGVLKDGRPIWAEVLDSQRGYSSNATDYGMKDLSFRPKWPPVQNMSEHNTWKSWHVVEENSRASMACEKVIAKPGITMNPLLILGESGCGKSHILSAATQAMIRRQDGNVHLLSATAMRGWESLPDGWEEAVAHANLIAIDDLHLAEERIATEIGLMIDYALNLGVQVIATSRVDSNEWQARRLWEVMRSATSIWLRKPSAPSLMTHLRREASGRALLLDDSMLAKIVKHGNGDWRSTDAAFEKVALGIESGEQIISSEDVTHILEDVPIAITERERFAEREDLEDIASRVISQTLDHVYTGTDIGGVELHAPLPTISDDWEVPELTIQEKDELHQLLTSENLIPHVTTTLTLDEREEFLIQSEQEIRGLDNVRARETAASISNITDEMFEEMSREHLDKSKQLAELESEMMRLSEISKDADVDELIEIADRVGEIESLLGDISGDTRYASLTPITRLTPMGEEE
ncbi:MAG: DnaA ATPase domain-containing protein [Candidatus Poseidoniaceae archaeon]|tara:strand:+ start:3088 stop:4839 length:1752 start_codon:yes stop_codon:yes gene_type:complete